MKNKLLLFVTSLLFSVITYAQEVPLQFKELPTNAQEFISEHFKSEFHHAIKIVIDKNITYQVYLNNETEIDFSDAGRWLVVDGKNKPVPYTFIQKQILDYIKINHEGDAIVKVQRTDLNYKTKLSSGLDLHFDKLGVFVKIN